jgi:uncharacterized protein (DUF488 family)
VKQAPVFTVGHSRRSTEAFVALLKTGRVDLVVDIRCTPRSRTNPQFNLDTLPEASNSVQYFPVNSVQNFPVYAVGFGCLNRPGFAGG